MILDLLQQHYDLRQSKFSNTVREQAWNTFLALGLPTQRHEHWRYTSVRALDALTALPSLGEVKAVDALLPEYAAKIVILDGRYCESQSTILNEAITVTCHEISETRLASHRHPFSHLSMALSEQLISIRVAASVAVVEPIEIIVMTTQAVENASVHLHHEFILEKSAKATVLMRYVSTAINRYWYNASTHLILKSGAALEWNTLQAQHDDAIHIEGIHAELAPDASATCAVLSLGAQLARFDLDTHFQHPGASCSMLGAYSVKDRQVVDFHYAATHEVGHCSTEQTVRGIADDKSRAVFNGKVTINKGASKSSSVQNNHNLLLSDRAEIDAKPELEIYHDDVACKHGATVGHLDAQALFYLQSRGIALDDAKAMLIEAFIKQVLDKISHQGIREAFTVAFQNRGVA